MGQITPDAQEMLHPNMNDNGKDQYEAGDLILADDMNKDMNSIVHDLQKLYYLTTADVGEDAPTGYDNTFIQYHRLNLENKINNNDIAVGAAIVYSKLNLANSIKNNDVAANAAIAYSKLNLTSSVKDADVAANAAIQKSKINFRNSDNTDGTIIDDDVSNISYAKLTLTNSIVDNDVASNAAIKKSKINFRNNTNNDGTIVDIDVASNAAIKKSKINFRNNANTDGTIVDSDVASNAAIKKSKINFRNDTNTNGTITKADFNSASFTGDGLIPADWIDAEHPVPYLPIRYDEGVLGRDGETGNLYQNVFDNKGYLTASDSDGRLVTTNITSSRANSVLNRSNITAGTGIPTWDVYGLITSSTQVYNKSININGTSYNLLSTSNNDLPSFYAPPAPNAGDANKYLAWNGSKFVYATPSSTTKVTLNGTQTTNAVFWAPTTTPSQLYSDATLMWHNTGTGGTISGKPIWKRVAIAANVGPAFNGSGSNTLNQYTGTTLQPGETKHFIISATANNENYKNGPIVVQTAGTLTGYYFIPSGTFTYTTSSLFNTRFVLKHVQITGISYNYSTKNYFVTLLVVLYNGTQSEQVLENNDVTINVTVSLTGFTRSLFNCDNEWR